MKKIEIKEKSELTMSESVKFCPSCGASINGGRFCENCGFDLKSTPKNPEGPTSASSNYSGSSPSPKSGAPYYNAETWKNLEPWISRAGEWSWILVIVSSIIGLIVSIVGFASGLSAWNNYQDAIAGYEDLFPYTGAEMGTIVFGLIWAIISILITIVVAAIFIKPFAQRCKARDWEGLLNNVFVIAGYRIPKMLVLGIVLEIFTDFWGGLLVLIPAILILLIGPIKHQWKV